MERWGPLECLFEMRQVDDSESGSSAFGRLGRLVREGGPGKEIKKRGQIENENDTGVIRVVLDGGIGVGSFSLRRNEFRGGLCPNFGLWDTLLVLWVAALFAALLRVLCEEIESQFGHFCGIISLIFRINVLRVEFLFGERDKFRDEPEVLPCMLVIERVQGRCLVIVKGKPEERTRTRRRGDLDRQKQIEKIDILAPEMVMCHGLRQPGKQPRKTSREGNGR